MKHPPDKLRFWHAACRLRSAKVLRDCLIAPVNAQDRVTQRLPEPPYSSNQSGPRDRRPHPGRPSLISSPHRDSQPTPRFQHRCCPRLAYKAEIDDPLRFRKSRYEASISGLTPRKYASGEVDRSGGISKCGNGALRTLLIEASVTMLTRSGKWSRLKAWGVRLAQGNGFKIASTVVARKLAVIMHRMWVDGSDFAYGDVPAGQAA
jgi:hypothetical protein